MRDGADQVAPRLLELLLAAESPLYLVGHRVERPRNVADLVALGRLDPRRRGRPAAMRVAPAPGLAQRGGQAVPARKKPKASESDEREEEEQAQKGEVVRREEHQVGRHGDVGQRDDDAGRDRERDLEANAAPAEAASRADGPR